MSKSCWTGGTVRQNLTRKIGHQQIQKILISKFFILKIFSQNLYACKRKIYNSAALIRLRSQTYNFTRCHVSEHAITIVNKPKVKIFLVISDFELQTDQRNKGLCNFKREALLSWWTPIAKEKTFLQKRLHSSVGRFKGKPKI